MNRAEAIAILGINANARLNKQMLETAYKAAALKSHPDKARFSSSATAEEKEKTRETLAEKFKNVTEAYQLLLGTVEEKYTLAIVCFEKDRVGDSTGPVDTRTFRLENERQIEIGLELLLDEIKSKKNIKAILVKSEKLPEHLRRMIIDGIIENKNIEQAKIVGTFLSKKENDELSKVMEDRGVESRLRVMGNFLLHPGYVAGIVAVSTLFFMCSIPLFFSVVAGFALNAGCMAVREEYLKRAEAKYSRRDDFAKASSPSEKEALKIGVEAKHWRGYFTSYLKPSAYKHPDAFAAGLSVALKEDEISTSKIKML